MIAHDAAPRERGVWVRLAQSAAAPGAGDLWRGLERRLRELPAGTAGVWAGLRERCDPARYRPRALPDVAAEPVGEGGQAYVVVRSPRGTYLRLTEAQRDVWRAMDGTRTIEQLGIAAFRDHGVIVPVPELAATLREEGLLDEQPVGIYRSLAAAGADRGAEGWGRRARRLLTGAMLPLPGVDRLYGALYRAGGRLLFTRAFAALALAVTLAGLAAFVIALASGATTYQVIRLNGSVVLGLAALWAVTLLSFVLHESAHALAVKHYGREVAGGGVMLYYGMPAAYVDTSDMWRSPTRARLVVSAAGPAADLLTGSVAALAAVALPDTAAGAIAFKLAFTSYVSSLFNLNPLLELDGYYMLSDRLRIPDLRRRALAFVRGPLWERLRAGVPLAGEERIFAWYGAATMAYTAAAIGGALWFWQRQILQPALELLGGPLWQRALGALLWLVVIAPVAAALLLAALEAGRGGLSWAIRHGYGRRPGLLVAAGAIVALLLALGAWVAEGQGRGWLGSALAPALWLAALAALVAALPDYRGAAIEPAVRALCASAGLAAAAGAARALLPELPLWIALDGLALLALLLAGFAALLDVDLRAAPPRELLGTAILLVLAFGAGALALPGAAAALPAAGGWVLAAAAAPAYFGALALALLLPHLSGLLDSRLVWAWALLWVGALAQTGGYIADLGRPAPALDVLAAGLWAAAWLAHLATLRQIAPGELRWPPVPSSPSEAERLVRAFQLTYAGCFRLLRAVYGERRARAVDDRMDVLAATADWDVTLDGEQARVGPLARALPVAAQGARFAEVLRYAVGQIEQIAGEPFARRCVQASYDALPWQERETAGRLCFPDTPWARALSSELGDARGARLRLLRQVDVLAGCDDGELQAIAEAAEERRVRAGEVLLQAGAPAPGLWIVAAGEVEARRGRQSRELHRGAAFGAAELIDERPATLTYRTTVESTLLYLPAADFRALAAGPAPHAATGVELAETLHLLERTALFGDLPRGTLRELAARAERREYPARAIVVRQGHPSGMLFVIRSGVAAVVVREAGAGGGTAQVRQVARLGPQELFGELELLRGTPPVASVVALAPLSTVAIAHPAVEALLRGDGEIARGLERLGSARILNLRTKNEEPRTESQERRAGR